jgi:hypothetical protein
MFVKIKGFWREREREKKKKEREEVRPEINKTKGGDD